ncbi:MAG: ATP-binding cassette domain-containing protein [Chloroflexi bacterium]|nr:ATP-binding cassette domain-containing protein [Chloroflexota bacterium]
MAEIRLEDIVVKYVPQKEVKFFNSKGVRNYMKDFDDQEFVSRVETTAEEELASRGTGTVFALDGVSITIPDGVTMAIVGPSGCGKSTLLRVVAGLVKPNEGTVYFDNKDVADVTPKDRMIGMVFQSYALYPHMKGEGNLGFFFKMRKRTDEEMMERIRITSEIMGIGFDTLLERKPGALSGGQQQRVAIGRCIVRDPSIFLFDEPLSNLDAKLRASTRVEIRRLLQRFKITAIYVTHDQVEAITLGDVIAVMRRGKIEQVGTYDEITRNPVNSFVAGFLGLPPMNLLEGWVVNEQGVLESDLGRLELAGPLAGQVKPGQELVLGFHSYDAKLSPGDEPLPSGGTHLQVEVMNSEPNFAKQTQLVHVMAGNLLFGVDAPIDMRVGTGWKMNVIVPEESIYLFDKESEMRIQPVVSPVAK